MTAVATWNETTIDGIDYWVIDTAKFRIPKNWDPTSQMFIAVGVPDGGVGFFQAVAEGQPGTTPNIDGAINFTPLAPTDPTADFASFTETAPNLYRLNLGLHTGQKGDDGDTIIDVNDYGTPVFDRMLRVKADLSGFELVARKVGDRYYPGSINNAPSGNPGYTLCSVSIPAQNFDWRPHVEGFTIFTGTGSNLVVDLVARLQVGGVSAETSGNIVAQCPGVGELSASTHIHPTHVLADVGGPLASINDTFDKVPAGSTAVIYLRGERRSGLETFTTSNATTGCKVRVCPIP